MGTPPIFESDFDCLTEKMSLAGTWKKVNVENGLAFGKAIGASDEQLAKQAKATSVVTYEINGNNIKVTRVHTIDGNDLKTVNSADIGSEAEFDTQGHKIKAVVPGDASSLALKAVSGYLSATAKIVDGKLVESVTHNESGQTVTSTWERQ